MATYDQAEYEVRCEWGRQGVARLAPISDVVVIVDVLSFCTSVSIATDRGAAVYLHHRQDMPVEEYAASIDAELAYFGRRYSLSPSSLLAVAPGTRLVLPSPNGALLSLATGDTPTLAGCWRNARAVAQAAQQMGRAVAVIPAGERWRDSGSLRPAIEDWIGAGAVIHYLPGRRSPEAAAAEAAFLAAQPDLLGALQGCSSGKEGMERGRHADVALAAQLNASDGAPLLQEESYRLWPRSS